MSCRRPVLVLYVPEDVLLSVCGLQHALQSQKLFGSLCSERCCGGAEVCPPSEARRRPAAPRRQERGLQPALSGFLTSRDRAVISPESEPQVSSAAPHGRTVRDDCPWTDHDLPNTRVTSNTSRLTRSRDPALPVQRAYHPEPDGHPQRDHPQRDQPRGRRPPGRLLLGHRRAGPRPPGLHRRGPPQRGPRREDPPLLGLPQQRPL